jgi:predicted dienelactone hydrolase
VHPLLHHPVPCVVAGNSLGGYAALYAAAANSHSKDLIRKYITKKNEKDLYLICDLYDK